MRISALIPEMAVNSIYRTLVPMQALAHRGHAIHIEERNEIRDVRALMESDLVHFMRFYHPAMQRLARQLKKAGVAVVWDNDDDLASIPKGSPTYSAFTGMQGQWVQSGISTMLRTADIVTTPSETLAERYRARSSAEVRVLDNYLPPTFTRPERVMPHQGIVIGWLAALEHHYDANELKLREVIEALLRRHHTLEIMTIGVDLGLSSNRYRPFPILLYGELPPYLVNFDIGIAPLADIPFNSARSNVKLKEYAAMGIPWLASPIGPYAGMGEQQGGRLVHDDGWYEELDRLILDADERSRLGRRGKQWAQTERIEAHADQWERTFEEAIERSRARSAVR